MCARVSPLEIDHLEKSNERNEEPDEKLGIINQNELEINDVKKNYELKLKDLEDREKVFSENHEKLTKKQILMIEKKEWIRSKNERTELENKRTRRKGKFFLVDCENLKKKVEKIEKKEKELYEKEDFIEDTLIKLNNFLGITNIGLSKILSFKLKEKLKCGLENMANTCFMNCIIQVSLFTIFYFSLQE